MRLKVKFKHKRFAKNLGPVRRGEIHLEETCVVVDGLFPRIKFPRLLLGAFKEAVCDWSQRSIPYSRITRVRTPRFGIGRVCQLDFTSADGKRRVLRFRIITKRRADFAAFAARIDEGRAVARTYLQA
jgi:hypothetical protein